MTDTPPIPPAFWSRILTFIKGGGTGQVILHVRRGRVLRGELREALPFERAMRRESVVDSPAVDRSASD